MAIVNCYGQKKERKSLQKIHHVTTKFVNKVYTKMREKIGSSISSPSSKKTVYPLTKNLFKLNKSQIKLTKSNKTLTTNS